MFATIPRLMPDEDHPFSIFLFSVILCLLRDQGAKTTHTIHRFMLEHNVASCFASCSFLNNSYHLICLLLSTDVFKELNAETARSLSPVVIGN